MNREKLREWRKKLTKHMRDGHRCEFRIDCEAVVQSIDAILAEPEGEAVAIAADLAARQQPPDPEFDRLIAHNLPDFLDDTAPASTADKAWPDDAAVRFREAFGRGVMHGDGRFYFDASDAERVRAAAAALTAAAPQAPVVTETMVEAVGSGLYIYWNDVSNSCRDKYREKVRRILTAALQQPASGEGDAIQQEAGR
jgi:hypothetical protein